MAYPAGHSDHSPTCQSDEASGLRFAGPMYGRDARDDGVEAAFKSLDDDALPSCLESRVGGERIDRSRTNDDLSAPTDVRAPEHHDATTHLIRPIKDHAQR